MSEALQTVHADDNTPKAIKDKNCPFCGQAFTSSSLGRHLDLYIKERNPKKPDGVHNVDEIRKLRGAVTRRQGLARRRHASMPAGTTPPALSNRSNASGLGGSSVAGTPVAHESGNNTDSGAAQLTADFLSAFPMGRLRWEATGVMNEVMVNPPDPRGETAGAKSDNGTYAHSDADADADVDADADADAGQGRGEYAGAIAEDDVDVHSKPKESNTHNRTRPSAQATARQTAKASLDTGKSLEEAIHTARAAELALRELIQCWRAADHATEIGLQPFDFDPLTMNFPALTLRCLRAQPTLFASTQLATPSSWSTAPPGTSQFEALQTFFKEAFRKWKIRCAAATTVQLEEFPYPPPPPTMQPADRNQVIHRAMKRADALEEEANRHLEMAFADWEVLPFERRTELWVLELARSLATKQTEVDQVRNGQTCLKQEIANLKIQIAQLNGLQQPREYKLMPPAHLPVDERIFFAMQDSTVSQDSHMIGLNLNDRHSDLSTIVTSAIRRWRKVLASVKSPGRAENTQQRRLLDAPTGAGAPTAGASFGPVVSMRDSTSPPPPTGPPAPLLGSLRGKKNMRRKARSSISTAAVRAGTGPAVALQQRAQQTRCQERGSNRNKDGDDVESDDDGEQNGDADTTGPSGLPGHATLGVPAQNNEEGKNGKSSWGRPNGGASRTRDDDKMSDKDADAEMDGDAFSHMHTPISRNMVSTVGSAAQASQQPQTLHAPPPLRHNSQQAVANHLQVPRIRGTGQKNLPVVTESAAGIDPPDSPLLASHPISNTSADEMHGFSDLDDLDMPTLGGDAMYTE